MTQYLHYETATGRLTGLCNYDTVQAGEDFVALDPSADFTDEMYRNTYILSGEPATRPTVPFPTPGAAPYSWDITGLPAGTEITVWNEAGEGIVVDDLSAALVLTDPGVYRITIRPPFPYVAIEDREFEVSDA